MNKKCTLLAVACMAAGVFTAQAASSTIPTGSGVYFLKSGSKGIDGGKYIATYDRGFQYMGDTIPSVNLSRGQWYIQENNGKYNVVDRNANTALILNGEITAVQDLPNAYTFGSYSDTIVVEYLPMGLRDKYLGSMYFTPDELSDYGYALNMVSGTAGVENLFAFTSDTLVQVKNADVKDALIFKLVPNDTIVVGGAQQIGDTLSVISYRFVSQFDNRYLAENKTDPKGVKFSTWGEPLAFVFYTMPDGLRYTAHTTDGRLLSSNVSTSYLGLTAPGTGEAAYFSLVEVNAPNYGTVSDGHKKIGSDNRYLTMNPLNRFAEMTTEGETILKAEYDADNFSLWVAKADTVVSGKDLYYITSALRTQGETVNPQIRYYLSSLRDSNKVFTNSTIQYYRVGFITGDTLTTMPDSPALFAFKTAQEGGYYLENLREMNRNASDKTPYVGYVNGVVVMQPDPSAVFTVESTTGPTANEALAAEEITILAGPGSVIIRNASGKKVSLSNILGKTVGSAVISSDYFTLPAEKGIVVVSVEGQTPQKVLVR